MLLTFERPIDVLIPFNTGPLYAHFANGFNFVWCKIHRFHFVLESLLWPMNKFSTRKVHFQRKQLHSWTDEQTENNEKSFRLIIHLSMEKYLAAKHLHKIFSGCNMMFGVLLELRILIYDDFKMDLREKSSNNSMDFSLLWPIPFIHSFVQSDLLTTSLPCLFLCVCIPFICVRFQMESNEKKPTFEWNSSGCVRIDDYIKNLIIKWAAVLLNRVMTFQCVSSECGQSCTVRTHTKSYIPHLHFAVRHLCSCECVHACVRANRHRHIQLCACLCVHVHQWCQSVDGFARQSGSLSLAHHQFKRKCMKQLNFCSVPDVIWLRFPVGSTICVSHLFRFILHIIILILLLLLLVLMLMHCDCHTDTYDTHPGTAKQIVCSQAHTIMAMRQCQWTVCRIAYKNGWFLIIKSS